MEKIVIYGAGGHARIIAEIIQLSGRHKLIGFIDGMHPERKNQTFGGTLILGGNEVLEQYISIGFDKVILAIGDNLARLKLANIVRQHGLSLASAVHPNAIVSPSASYGLGTVIAAGAIISAAVVIGENVIINTGATIDHDCSIEDGVHISPGVNLGGEVFVGRGTWVGIGSSVRDHIRIGKNCIIGAGSVVVSDLPSGVLAYGVPAKVIRELM